MKHFMSVPLLFCITCISISSCSGGLRAEIPKNPGTSGDTQQVSETMEPASRDPVPAPPVHPDFHLTLEQLEERIRPEPAAVSGNILQRPRYFLQLISEALSLQEWALILVDKRHSLSPEQVPDDLVYLKDYPLSLNRESLQLSGVCMPDVLAMTEAARSDGVELVFSSAFRSYDYQKKLYENYVSSYGQEEADRFSARPGTSQHQLGTAIDFGSITPEFGDTAQGRWLRKHAWEYGFSLSYPEGMEEITGYMFEIWHYRYITRTGTLLEREFFDDVQQYMSEFMHRHGEFFSSHLIQDRP